MRAVRTPLGSHDAWAMWTYRAKGLFLLDGEWADAQGFLQATPAPDHPLLLPITTWRFAEAMGSFQPLAAQQAGWLFFVSAVLMLVAATKLLRGGTAAALAGLLLVSTRELVISGASQLADMPVSCFQLVAFVLLACACRDAARRKAQLLAAGCSAGLAAWTKNEGLVFLLAFLLASTLPRNEGFGMSRSRRLALLGLGALLPLSVLLSSRLASPSTTRSWGQAG